MVHEQVVGVVAPYAEDWSTSCSFFRLRFNFLLRSMELCALGTEGNISTIGHSVWFLSLVWITPVHDSSTPIAFWTNRATKNPSMLSREGSVRKRWCAANIDTKRSELLEVTEPHTLSHTHCISGNTMHRDRNSKLYLPPPKTGSPRWGQLGNGDASWKPWTFAWGSTKRTTSSFSLWWMEQVLYTTLSTAGTANHPQQYYVRIFLSTLVYHAWQRRYLLYQSSMRLHLRCTGLFFQRVPTQLSRRFSKKYQYACIIQSQYSRSVIIEF